MKLILLSQMSSFIYKMKIVSCSFLFIIFFVITMLLKLFQMCWILYNLFTYLFIWFRGQKQKMCLSNLVFLLFSKLALQWPALVLSSFILFLIRPSLWTLQGKRTIHDPFQCLVVVGFFPIWASSASCMVVDLLRKKFL